MRRLLLAAAALFALAAPAPAAADVDVQITAFGYDPADVTVRPGEAIHWTNVQLLGQSVTSGAGLFDSGIVPPGGGYSMATSVPGLHVYGSSANPALRGTIRVLSPRLGGDPAAPAADAIPDLPFPPPRAAEVAEHPTYGVGASTTRVLLGVEANATVGDVNEALASVQAEVLGGLPRLGILLVQVPEVPTWTEDAVDVGRFTGLTAALGRLRASSAFEFAAMSTEVEQSALPRRADEAAESLPGVWHWDGAGGANWGLKDARFPFAWNLRESIARDEPSVVTGIVDGGFYDHPDLTQLEVRQQLCPTGGGCVATPNNGNDDFRTHGTHVAGIIGAAWDNPASLEPPRSPRSKGVSGGNPFARLVGTSFAAANLYDTTVGLFDAFLRSRPDELRVINFSGKMVSPDPAALAASFPLPTCGPGEADDDLPGFQAGTTFACTPNIEDGWLRQVAAAGMAARRVAAAAAEDGVVIVAASGNDSDTYCTPFGDPSCVTRPIRASHAAEFAWASEHWEDDVANPIFVVEATAPNGRPTRFSNPGGDIAAPGLDVGSTVGSGGYGLLSGTSMAAPHVSAAIGYLLAAEPDLTIEGIRERLLDWGRQPPPATPPPEHVFDWNVPDHLGHDADLDAIVDPHDSSADVVRDGYPVELDACDWSVGGDPIVKFTWTLNGETLERTTCGFRYTFPAEGSYAVTVTFTDADGDDHTGTRTVTVDDLLVVAVGDALAAGEGNPDELGSSPFAGARWQDGRCHRSARGGVAQAPRWLEIANTESSVTFVDLACSGARIRGDRDANGTLVPGPDGEGGLLTPYGGAEPGASPLAPQLDDLAAVRGSRAVDALVLYAGAGDLRLREILLDCLRPGNNCATGAGLALFQQRQPLLAGRYDELAARLAELGVAANRVFAGEYPDFTRSSAGAPDLGCVPGGAVTAAEATWLAETVLPQLNAAVHAAATRHGWTAIGGVADDFRTHGYCAGDPWVNTASAAELERLALGDPAVAGAFHPNTPGQAALASRVVAAIHAKLGLGPVNARRLVGDAAPRLDVFASLLAGEGIARRLVDVNDPSRDGNRRVVRDLDAEGAITTSLDRLLAHADGERTEPDGDVDMRDFRRFRDAWLLECLLRTGDTACPGSSSDIELDGGDDHLKRDLNIDGCVRQGGDPAGCGAAEYEYSRFDFNGDGHTSVERRALVPLTAEGTPAARPWDAAKLTDLDLLRGQWSPSPRADEGWEAGDLERLLRSGDVTVHPGRLLAHGAREGEVQVQTLAGEAVGTARTLKRRDGSLVVTVPVADPTATLQVVGTASTARGTVTVRSTPFSLRYGEDMRADLCAGLNLEASSLRLPTEGQAESTFTATLHRCGAEPELGGKVVSWTVAPETSGGPQLDAETTATDGSGRSSVRLRSGTEAGSYTIKATVDLGAGETEAAELSVTLVAPVTIRYAWRQEVDEWSEEGSTKWEPFLDPLRPDCLTAGVEYCIDTFRIALDPDSPYELERSGRLTGIDDHVRLTETVSNSLGRARSTWTVSRPNEQPQDGGELTEWSVTDPTRYADHALADVTIEDADDGIRLRGLQVVGDLPYHYSLTAQSFPGADALREVHSTRREFLLVPQGEGRHLRFAAHPEHELVFPRTGGGFEQFASCGQLGQDLTTEPGYLVLDEEEDEFLSATSLRRKPDFEPGDRPMPVGPGSLHVRYAFAATVGYDGEEPPEPELPSCAGDEAPVADFELPLEPVDEGEVVQFRDASTDADHDIATYEWETSSPAWALSLADLVDREPWAGTAGSASPSFVFADEGPVTVKLTVTDSAGETATVDKALTVMNVPPEASLDDADAEVGTEARIWYRVLDASHVDRAALRVRITSSHPAWVPIDRVEQAGVHFQTRLGLPAGTYPLTLTVTDPDGATTRDSATLVVSSVPPDDEHPGGGASPTCEPTVVLDSEERDFLELVNDYRDANGLPPVIVSPTLSRAAERHAADMAENDFLDHTGSDGSTAGERAWDAGYPRSAAVGENLTEGAAGFDALWSWRGSVTGHNENMLVPEWRAIGISRVEGSVWKWATSYGNKLDCPGAGQPAPPGPEATGLDATFSGTAAGGDALDEPATTALAGESSPFSLRFADLAAASEATAAHETAAAEAPTPPTVAFTLSDATPREGTPVVFTNRSRDATGTPVGATLHLDAPTELALGPDESTSHAFPTAGARSVRLVAGDAELARPLDVAQKLPLTLEYLGSSTAYAGGRLDVLVRADDSAAAVPVAGAELTFELADAAAAATTGADGRAAALLAVPTAVGSYELTVGFAGNDDFLAAQISATIEVLANAPPVADAGGPYVLGEGQALFLDGTRSRDADTGDRVLRWQWDLNGDGSYSDANGATPAALPWATLQLLVCGGSCQIGHDYPLSLRVEDTRGTAATATTKVTFTADFSVVMAGGTITLVPGASNHFGLTVVGSSTWTHPVTLSVQGLPAGVTASFSRNPVTPTGTSVLTLTASSSAASGSFAITVTGTGNGITRVAGADVEVTFGLIPKCFGTFAGTVTDRDTGQPLADAAIFLSNVFTPDTVTDANGRYVLGDVELGFNNAPVTRGPRAAYAEYWEQQKFGELACGVVTQLDFGLRSKRPGRVSGRVIDKETRQPIPGATATYHDFVSPYRFTTDADGRFAGEVGLSPDNAPKTYVAQADAAGYWSWSEAVTATADSEATVAFELVRKCFAMIGGGIVYRQGTQIPVANASVALSGFNFDTVVVTTDAEGRFRLDRQLPLGHNNQPLNYSVGASPPPGSPSGSQGSGQVVNISQCGQVVPELVLTVHIVTQNFGSVDGFVRDEETGEPLAGAIVNGATTDATGYYRIDNIFIGVDATTTRGLIVSASKSDYWDTSFLRTITANTTTRVDLLLLRKRSATAAGTVTEAVTGAPIAEAIVDPFGIGTDGQGRYGSTVALGFRNAPVTTGLTARAPGYWPVTKSATYQAGQTTTTDFQLIRECSSARVTGRVVNAVTQEPIQGAFIQTHLGSFAVTDATGRFMLTGLRAGVDNAPVVTTLTASAPGFNFAQRQITIFCGANIVVDFGNSTSNTASIAGTVTNLDTGQPIAGASVGAEFGAVATTDASGNFRFPNVPLGHQDADREWKVTATVQGFRPLTQAVVARTNQEARADFGFTKAGNTLPVADPKTYVAHEDVGMAPQPLKLTGSDADGDALTFHIMRHPLHGRVRGFPPDVDYVATEPNYHGPDSFEYATFDGQDLSLRATVDITVLPVNDAPRATNDAFQRPLGAAARILVADILANDSDADGDTLSLTSASAFFPAQARIEGNELVVTPATNQTMASVLYSITDGNGAFANARIDVSFVATPLAPVCADASFGGPQDELLSGRVLCTDGNGDALTYAVVLGPETGTLSFQPDGTFEYEPPTGFSGSVEFDFTASDAALTSAPATATLVLEPTNGSPLAADGNVELDEDTSAPIPLTATDPDGDPLTYAVVAPPAHGTLSGTPPALTYTPAADYHGPDSFTFRASDDTLADEATMSITVRPVNDPPAAAADTAETNEDEPLALAPAALLANDGDVDGDPLTLTAVGEPVHGTVALAGGTVVFTPAAGFAGTAGFDYTVEDGHGASATAHVTVTVRSLNDAPVAADASVALDEDTPAPIALAAGDPDGDPLGFTVVSSPAHGALSGTAPNLIYTPAANYHGPDSFSFRASDGTLADEATVSITVRPVNDEPIAADDAAATNEDKPLALAPATLLANDTDADGDALTVTAVGGATHGTVVLQAGNVVFSPAPGFSGAASFRYTISDGQGGMATAGVAVTVAAVNRAPAVELAGVAPIPEATAVTLTATGSDPDGDALTYSWHTTAGELTATGATARLLVDDGPAQATVTVRVTDPAGESAGAGTVVDVVNIPPTANAGPDRTTPWGVPLSLSGAVSDPSRADTTAGLDPRWSSGAEGLTAELTFAEPGVYLAALTATDKDGDSSTDVAQVRVDPRGTALTWTGEVTDSAFGHVALSARLADLVHAPTALLGGRTVTFHVGGQSYDATTDALGDARVEPALVLAPGSHAVRIAFAGDGRYGASETAATVNVGAPARSVLVLVDENALDNGAPFHPSGGAIVPSGPSFFGRLDVNADRAGVAQRAVLRYFASRVGSTITIRTGQTGDEGWFAPACIPQRWLAGTSSACLTGGARDSAIDRFFGRGGAASIPSQGRLEKVPAVLPLRARGLMSLVGENVCAVVYDGDVGLNYSSSSFPYTEGNLQGAVLGLAAFEVKAVRRLSGFSSSTLPEVQLTIRDPAACSGWALLNAPVPRSTSVPNDVDPARPAGTGSSGYRTMLVRPGEALFL